MLGKALRTKGNGVDLPPPLNYVPSVCADDNPANFNPTVIETFERDAGGFSSTSKKCRMVTPLTSTSVALMSGNAKKVLPKTRRDQDATIVPMDYQSDYIEENGYVDANGDFQAVNGYDGFINELLEQDDADGQWEQTAAKLGSSVTISPVLPRS